MARFFGLRRAPYMVVVILIALKTSAGSSQSVQAHSSTATSELASSSLKTLPLATTATTQPTKIASQPSTEKGTRSLANEPSSAEQTPSSNPPKSPSSVRLGSSDVTATRATGAFSLTASPGDVVTRALTTQPTPVQTSSSQISPQPLATDVPSATSPPNSNQASNQASVVTSSLVPVVSGSQPSSTHAQSTVGVAESLSSVKAAPSTSETSSLSSSIIEATKRSVETTVEVTSVEVSQSQRPVLTQSPTSSAVSQSQTPTHERPSTTSPSENVTTEATGSWVDRNTTVFLIILACGLFLLVDIILVVKLYHVTQRRRRGKFALKDILGTDESQEEATLMAVLGNQVVEKFEGDSQKTFLTFQSETAVAATNEGVSDSGESGSGNDDNDGTTEEGGNATVTESDKNVEESRPKQAKSDGEEVDNKNQTLEKDGVESTGKDGMDESKSDGEAVIQGGKSAEDPREEEQQNDEERKIMEPGQSDFSEDEQKVTGASTEGDMKQNEIERREEAGEKGSESSEGAKSGEEGPEEKQKVSGASTEGMKQNEIERREEAGEKGSESSKGAKSGEEGPEEEQKATGASTEGDMKQNEIERREEAGEKGSESSEGAKSGEEGPEEEQKVSGASTEGDMKQNEIERSEGADQKGNESTKGEKSGDEEPEDEQNTGEVFTGEDVEQNETGRIDDTSEENQGLTESEDGGSDKGEDEKVTDGERENEGESDEDPKEMLIEDGKEGTDKQE